jgi:hypothetical protein
MNWNLIENLGKLAFCLTFFLLALAIGFCIYKDWRRGAFMLLACILFTGLTVGRAQTQSGGGYVKIVGTMVSFTADGLFLRCEQAGYFDSTTGADLAGTPVAPNGFFLLKKDPKQETLTEGLGVGVVAQVTGVYTYQDTFGRLHRVPCLTYVSELAPPVETTPPVPASRTHYSMDSL